MWQKRVKIDFSKFGVRSRADPYFSARLPRVRAHHLASDHTHGEQRNTSGTAETVLESGIYNYGEAAP